jgi:hypothetical protein
LTAEQVTQLLMPEFLVRPREMVSLGTAIEDEQAKDTRS